MIVRRFEWQRFPGRVELPWRCPSCRKAVAELVKPKPQKGDLTACPLCLSALRFDDDCMHKVRANGVTRLVYEQPTIALELLNMIEDYARIERRHRLRA